MKIPYKLKRIARGVRKEQRGQRVNFVIHWPCSLDCSYCCIKWHNDMWPQTKSMPFEGWGKIIDSLYEDVQEIVLSGGEPQLHPDFVEICNYILAKDILCNVDTNLLHRKGLQVNKSNNLVFYVSHHKEMTAQQENVWWKNMDDYKKAGYRIRCDYPDIDDKLTTKAEGFSQTFERFRPMYDPQGKLYGSFGELMKAQRYGKDS